jgi:hypothetical protein
VGSPARAQAASAFVHDVQGSAANVAILMPVVRKGPGAPRQSILVRSLLSGDAGNAA